MRTPLFPALAVALVLAGPACQRAPEPGIEAYLAQARGQTRGDPASGYLSLAEAEANAEARFEVALAQANQELKSAIAHCEASDSGDSEACVSDAESEFASARAAARAEREAAITVARREFGDAGGAS